MNPIVKYFTGERLESFLFIGLGILGFAIAIFFYFILKTSFLKGVAIPFLLVSFLEIVVGGLNYNSAKYRLDCIMTSHREINWAERSGASLFHDNSSFAV